ncbi:hypothetical protein LCGC14_0559990 [marine sediment metagenome]|uniref:Uncharacterized protein n=1 Tax=marine sediment metagenome TaxID=412755 RepID=A0A0F9S5W3_9ZZZZ
MWEQNWIISVQKRKVMSMKIRNYYRYIIKKEQLMRVVDKYLDSIIKLTLKYMFFSIKKFYEKLDK